jgi:hypothetical protein
MCGLIFIFEREKLKINISSIVVFLAPAQATKPYSAAPREPGWAIYTQPIAP